MLSLFFMSPKDAGSAKHSGTKETIMAKPNLTLEEKEQVYAYSHEHSAKETAEHFSISDSTVYNIRAHFNTEPTLEALEALEQGPQEDTVGNLTNELNELREALEIQQHITDTFLQTLAKNTELEEELKLSKKIIRKLVE